MAATRCTLYHIQALGVLWTLINAPGSCYWGFMTPDLEEACPTLSAQDAFKRKCMLAAPHGSGETALSHPTRW